MNRVLITTFLALSASSVLAQSTSVRDAALASLPPFCQVKLAQPGTPQDAAMSSRFGAANWLHMHHYCYALTYLQKARAAKDQQARATGLRDAIDNYMYVINKAERGFWMRPQIYTELGRVLMEARTYPEATRWFTEAATFSPGYVQAYVGLIDVHRRTGNRAAALEAATEGLRHAPDYTPLQKAYLELGGTKPFPAPAVARKAEPVESPDAVASPVVTPEVEAPPQGVDQRAAKADSEASSTVPARDDIDRGCRFCPPEEVQKRWRDSFGEPSRQ